VNEILPITPYRNLARMDVFFLKEGLSYARHIEPARVQEQDTIVEPAYSQTGRDGLHITHHKTHTTI
jgi:hypothetical protein